MVLSGFPKGRIKAEMEGKKAVNGACYDLCVVVVSGPDYISIGFLLRAWNWVEFLPTRFERLGLEGLVCLTHTGGEPLEEHHP
jgi:hypothetical protein